MVRSESWPTHPNAPAERRGMCERVLVIDDDEMYAEMVVAALERAGYQAKTAGNGIEGVHRMLEFRPDLIILDLIMPRMDGFETCRRIREISDVPVIMLTGVIGSSSEVRGLGEGADLYMTKPFEIELLLARVQAVLRRHHSVATRTANGMITVGDLEIDPARSEASLSGRPLDLSATEYRLLIALAASVGCVIPSDELIREVWSSDAVGDQEQYLKLYIHYLRKKIEDDPSRPRYIRNRRGIGYLLSNPETPDD